jgi:hypothetical protein
MRASEHRETHPDEHAAALNGEAHAADAALPEARISEAQLQAARRIVEREVRELRAQMARDAAAAPPRDARPA